MEYMNPAVAMGGVLFGVGLIGILQLLLRALLLVPLEVWIYLSIMLLGLGLMLTHELPRFWNDGSNCEQARKILVDQLRRLFSFAMHLMLLANIPYASYRTMQILFSDVHPIVTAIVSKWRTFTGNMVVKPPIGDEDFSKAMTWLQRPQLSLGYDEQLQLYGLVKQASSGDCTNGPSANPVEGPLARAKRQSWEAQRGLSRIEAARQVTRKLLELDFAFRNAHPRLACSVTPTAPVTRWASTITDLIRVILELVERCVPCDVDERMAYAKQRLLVRAFILGTLVFFWRHDQLRILRRLVGRVPIGRISAVFSLAYLSAITYGLPPMVHACLPRMLHTLPLKVSNFVQVCIGGPAPRLSRWVVQALIPPVWGSILNDRECGKQEFLMSF